MQKARARLGKVFIYMRDPNIAIENEGPNELMGKGIPVEDFHPEFADKIRQNLLWKVMAEVQGYGWI